MTEEIFGEPTPGSIVIISASVATQVLRLPWAAPVNGKGKIRKIQITTTNPLGNVVMFWDADLSSATPAPATRGTGTITDAYFSLAVPPAPVSGAPATTVVYGKDDLPAFDFNAGVAAAIIDDGATQIGVEVDVY